MSHLIQGVCGRLRPRPGDPVEYRRKSLERQGRRELRASLRQTGISDQRAVDRFKSINQICHITLISSLFFLIYGGFNLTREVSRWLDISDLLTNEKLNAPDQQNNLIEQIEEILGYPVPWDMPKAQGRTTSLWTDFDQWYGLGNTNFRYTCVSGLGIALSLAFLRRNRVVQYSRSDRRRKSFSTRLFGALCLLATLVGLDNWDSYTREVRSYLNQYTSGEISRLKYLKKLRRTNLFDLAFDMHWATPSVWLMTAGLIGCMGWLTFEGGVYYCFWREADKEVRRLRVKGSLGDVETIQIGPEEMEVMTMDGRKLEEIGNSLLEELDRAMTQGFQSALQKGVSFWDSHEFRRTVDRKADNVQELVKQQKAYSDYVEQMKTISQNLIDFYRTSGQHRRLPELEQKRIKLEEMKIEAENAEQRLKQLEAEKRIETLKAPPAPKGREDKVEKEIAEAVGKMKVIEKKLEYKYDFEKRIRSEYPSDQAEEILEGFRRALHEEQILPED